MKFHVNAKGEAGKCSATKGGCPFGGEAEHFTSPEAARTAYEQKQTELYGDINAAQKDLSRYGADSAVFRTWSKIHSDFKTNTDGVKRVLANDKGATVLAPWRGPKVLEELNRLNGFQPDQEPTGPMAGWTMTENSLDLSKVRIGERYYDKFGSAYVVEAHVRGLYAELNPLDESGNPLGAPGRGPVKVSADKNAPEKFRKLVNLQDSGKYTDGAGGFSESKAIKPLPESGSWPKAVSAQVTYYDENEKLQTIELVAPVARLTDAKRIELARQLWAFTGKDPQRFEDVSDKDKLHWANQKIMRRSNFEWKTDQWGVSFTHDMGGGSRGPDSIKLVELN